MKAFGSFDESLAEATSDVVVDKVFVIGGGQIYQEALKSSALEKIYRTLVLKDFECDTFFEFKQDRFELEELGNVNVDGAIPYQFQTWVARPVGSSNGDGKTTGSPPAVEHEEMQYLNLIRRILTTGNRKSDRTGVGTMSLFGAQMRFDLSNSFPLLTTKRTFFRGVAEELIWLINGSTDSKELAAKKVHIWDANGSRAFLDKSGFSDREEGDLGPVYGFQWRHFGATYTVYNGDYEGQGTDQLMDVVNLIKNNPDSRRILMSAWNAADIKKMALPPCHVLCQFYVFDGKLSCQLYQRSCDMGLGVPFNIASYALLTCILAKICDLQPGEFIHTLGDAHVYLNHIEALTIQLERTPFPFPTLRIAEEVTSLEGLKYEHFVLENYVCHKGVKMAMAV